MSEGTSPSSSSDDGSRSTPSNLSKAATRASKKRTSESEDEDYRAEEDEATSKRVEPAQGTKPGLKIKRPAGRQPMLKARASTEKPAPKEPKRRKPQTLRMKTMWQKRMKPLPGKCSRRSMALLQPPSQV